MLLWFHVVNVLFTFIFSPKNKVMNFIVIKTRNGGKDYLVNTLAAAMQISEKAKIKELANSMSSNMGELSGPRPVIAKKEDFFEITDYQRKMIEVAQRCALQELVRNAPLLEGEIVESDFFSYLLEPFEEHEAYTAILVRTTNMAEVIFFFDLVRIENGNVIHLVPPPPVAENVPKMSLKAAGGFDTSFIFNLLKAGGTSFASAIGSKLGVIVLNIVMEQVFGKEDDTEHLLNEIKKLLKAEIVGTEVAKLEGTVSGALRFLSGEYKNKRAQTDVSTVAGRDRLMATLLGPTQTFYELIGILENDKFAEEGLKTYLFAAAVHLLITQEMALIDPDNMNPNESGYLLTLRDNAAHYKGHVARTFRSAMDRRNNMELKSEKIHTPTSKGYSTTTRWWWKDHVTGETKSGFVGTKNPSRTAEENAHNSFEDHRRTVLNTRKMELGNPEETFLPGIGAWINFSFPKDS
jgi:hypothetical protein